MLSKKSLKTIAPIAITLAIVGIWFAKNLPERAEMESQANLKFPLTVTSVNLEELQAHNMPIIIDFGADSCVPCIEMAPVLKKLNAEMQDSVIIQFVDVWKNPQASQAFPLQVIPTQFFFTKDAKPYMPSAAINVDFLLYGDEASGTHYFTAHQGGLTEEQMREIIEDMNNQAANIAAGDM